MIRALFLVGQDGGKMIRIDGSYLYSVGGSLRPLSQIQNTVKFSEAALPLYIAEGALRPFLFNSVFKLKTSLIKGNELLSAIVSVQTAISQEQDQDKELGWFHAYTLSSAYTAFETILQAEMQLADIYLVTKKRGYDTSDLIERGWMLFPDDLLAKVPEALLDITQGSRCLAFELPTASAFHFHRANESVLHRYYDAVTGGKPRPNGRNIGDYINELMKHKVGDPKVLSALKDLKDLHRNPLIHPEHTLESIDEAVAVLGSIQSAIIYMLKEVPAPPPDPASAPGAAVVP
jgi:hypothetical protein